MLTPLEAELLAALKRMLGAHDADVEHGSLIAIGNSAAADQARNAIAKAEAASQSGPMVPLDIWGTMATLRDAAQSHLDDLESGLADGTYDAEFSGKDAATLEAAIDHADRMLVRSHSMPMPGNAPPSGEPGASGVKVTLTEAERVHVRMALRIAIEDGSIYGGSTSDSAVAIVNARHESIVAKLERRK
jgi:hypothetical protein